MQEQSPTSPHSQGRRERERERERERGSYAVLHRIAGS